MGIEEIMKSALIAEPCPVKWEAMAGDDKVRFCGQCKLNVFHASAMTDEEVLHKLSKAVSGERVCMQLYRRSDGTFLTKNCPVGVQNMRRLRDRAHKVAGWIAGGVSMLLSTAASAAPDTTGGDCKQGEKPVWHSTIKTGDSKQTSKKRSGGTANVNTAGPATPMLGGAIAVMPSTEEQIAAQIKRIDDEKAKSGADSKAVALQYASLAYMNSSRSNHKAAMEAELQALHIYENLKEYDMAADCCVRISMYCLNLKDTAGASKYAELRKTYSAMNKPKQQ